MNVGRLFLRWVSLPFDFILLTREFLRWTFWLLWRAIHAVLFRGDEQAPTPCREWRHYFGVLDGPKRIPCRFSARFGTPGLLRLLCPWVEPVDHKGGGVNAWCTVRQGVGIPFLAYLRVAVLMVAVWGGVGTALAWRLGWRSGAAGKGKAPAVAADAASKARSKSAAYMTHATVLMADGEYKKAFIEYRNAVQSDPTHTAALLGAGNCALRLKAHSKAAEFFESAVLQDPGCVPARVALSDLALRSRDYQAAVRHAEAAVGLAPDDPSMRLRLSRCHRAAGNLEPAMTEAAKALEMAPADVALKYKELWMVEALFREVKSVLQTRPIYHKCDETIRGHVFCSFLALVLLKELTERMEARGWDVEWERLKRELDALEHITIQTADKTFVIRSELRGDAGKAIQAAGVALGPVVRICPPGNETAR